jgi:hypothetical protein
MARFQCQELSASVRVGVRHAAHFPHSIHGPGEAQASTMIRPRFRTDAASIIRRAAPPRRSPTRFASSQSTAAASATAPPPKPRRSRLLYAWYGLVLFGGVTAGLAVRNLVRPALPVPGSREDEVLLAALASDVEQLDVVKFMRARVDPGDGSSGGSEGKGWVELDVKTHITESKDVEGRQTRTITGQALAGSKGLGVQRAFWNAATKELVAAVWIGPAMSGWPMMAHGGGIATIFEDCMSRMVAGPDASIGELL